MWVQSHHRKKLKFDEPHPILIFLTWILEIILTCEWPKGVKFRLKCDNHCFYSDIESITFIGNLAGKCSIVFNQISQITNRFLEESDRPQTNPFKHFRGAAVKSIHCIVLIIVFYVNIRAQKLNERIIQVKGDERWNIGTRFRTVTCQKAQNISSAHSSSFLPSLLTRYSAPELKYSMGFSNAMTYQTD